MIKVPTVLVLGAGASQHCGYPIGRDLVTELATLRGGSVPRELMPQGWNRDTVEQFLIKLSRSDPTSIDAFLERNLDHAPLGKYLIARHLKQRENLDDLFPPRDAGWYRQIFNRLLVDGRPSFEKSNLKIITFNYDRSLEAYVLARLQAEFDMNDEVAVRTLKLLPIVHVHGILGEYPEHPYSSATSADGLLAISKKIQIVHEITDQDGAFCNEMFRTANAWLRCSERIYFLGFGFHDDNIRRFQFFYPGTEDKKAIGGTLIAPGTFDRNNLLNGLHEKFGLNPRAFHSIQCNDFFRESAPLD